MSAAADAAAGYIKGEAIRCSWGLAEPCQFVAKAYRYGLGVRRDSAMSLKYFDSACSLGLKDSCVMLGVAIVENRDQPQFGNALTVWERACEYGSYQGCYLAGGALTLDPWRLGAVRDVPRGRAYLEKGCSARYLPACYVAAATVFQQQEQERYRSARAQLVELCGLRETQSCDYLGRLEVAGTFGQGGATRALKPFWRACYDGFGESCFALAYLYSKGVGTAADPELATRLLSEACRFGYRPACEASRHPKLEVPAP